MQVSTEVMISNGSCSCHLVVVNLRPGWAFDPIVGLDYNLPRIRVDLAEFDLM